MTHVMTDILIIGGGPVGMIEMDPNPWTESPDP